MKTLLEFIIQNIVDKPEEVEIKEEKINGQTNFSLKVAPDDMGKVIGKKGKIIKSVRQLLRVKAFKSGEKVNLILEETEREEEGLT